MGPQSTIRRSGRAKRLIPLAAALLLAALAAIHPATLPWPRPRRRNPPSYWSTRTGSCPADHPRSRPGSHEVTGNVTHTVPASVIHEVGHAGAHPGIL